MSRIPPSEDQLAAIVAAVELVWPQPVVVAPATNEAPNWRWSGRWWGPSRQDVASSRRRPWA